MFPSAKFVRVKRQYSQSNPPDSPDVLSESGSSRRRFVLGASSALALATLPFPRSFLAAAASTDTTTISGNVFDLDIDYKQVNFTGRARTATTVNQGLPGPTLRWKEGERVTLRVANRLQNLSSIHWHGIILPADMDGVPGMSFDGISPGETFEYQFDVTQSGTYWYHSHSGFQEQTGLYGAIIIDPKDPDPVVYDRDYVVMLSDWTDEDPDDVYAKLKKASHYYNFNERTVSDVWQDVKEKGIFQTWRDRAMWNQMRMSQTDLADVTGYTYTFLMNGITPDSGWTGIFTIGEKVRLRFINAAAMTVFDVRIPGLKMTVVAADGQNIQPVPVDEFRISVAETYDVIVEPVEDGAFTVFAQTSDRTGYARGTLTSNPALTAEVPPMDPAPLLGHQDMGMGDDHSGHNMDDMAMDHSQHEMNAEPMDHSQHGIPEPEVDHSQHAMPVPEVDHSQHAMPVPEVDHSQNGSVSPLGRAGMGSNFDAGSEISHRDTEYGPGVDMRSESPQSGLHDPGLGLRDHDSLYGRRVLRYADIRNLYPTLDKREPTREIQLHLTGNMNRYMWSINGIPFADAQPLDFEYGERLRVVLVNDTMMAHPIHLHGMWSELETGDPDYIPRKHTVIVQPGSTISYLVTADALGRWAYHCHMLYHMPGMMREVRVIQGDR
ncbi:MAG: copper resistance system multicopper oxidase [Pseudohongiella sp.]|nr:copper resistance system multicopper oxidase [Pseudohongiella sp.]